MRLTVNPKLESQSRRLAVLEPQITSYRIPLFNALAEQYEAFWVYYLRESHRSAAAQSFSEETNFSSRRLAIGRVDGLHIGNGVRESHALLRTLIGDQISVIISAGYASHLSLLGLLYARLMDMPFVLTSASNALSIQRTSGLAGAYRRCFIALADSYVAYSKAAAGSLVDWGAARDAVFLAPNAIDNVSYKIAVQHQASAAQAIRASLGLGSPALLFVGRLEAEKGLESLVKAYRLATDEVPCLHLIIVGDGSLRKSLELETQDLPQVHFTGFVQPAHLPAYYALADGLVLPSVRETWGFVVNEAMASGLPVIVTDRVGCAGELVQDGLNGFIVGAGTEEAMADAIVRLFTNTDLRRRMASGSMEKISEFTIERATQAFDGAISYAWRKRCGS
jgi:glycosyltransferase involved in cell wall biosynthesis